MIFATGLALFILGIVLIRVFGCSIPGFHNNADYIGALCFFVGSIMLLGSCLILAIKYLP